jgi:hypothetical protein
MRLPRRLETGQAVKKVRFNGFFRLFLNGAETIPTLDCAPQWYGQEARWNARQESWNAEADCEILG